MVATPEGLAVNGLREYYENTRRYISTFIDSVQRPNIGIYAHRRNYHEVNIWFR